MNSSFLDPPHHPIKNAVAVNNSIKASVAVNANMWRQAGAKRHHLAALSCHKQQAATCL